MAGPSRTTQGTGLPAFREDLRRQWHRFAARSSSAHVRFVALLILAGLAFRMGRLFEPITYDEAFNATRYALRPLGHLLSNYAFPTNHILFSLLLKMSFGLFGVHTWSMRLPALLAGIAVMPLYYAFVRTLFNRYIAVIALALVASSGPLVEYSVLGRGYSLTWLFLMAALLAARHFAKKENTISLLLVAVFGALGMWTVPTMLYGMLLVYIWLWAYLGSLYRTTLRRRILKVLGSLGLFVGLSLLLYAPVIITHSADHVIHHPALGDSSWKNFVGGQQDRAFELWGYFNDTAATWISVLGFIALVYAAYTSSKYRLLLMALVLGAVPLVFMQRLVAPPRVWTYVLFVLHLGSAIAVFYGLKSIQERFLPTLDKRRRTAAAALVLLAGMGWLALTGPKDTIERFPDADRAARWAKGRVGPTQVVLTTFPWDAPVAFSFRARGVDPTVLSPLTVRQRPAYVLVGPGDGQTLGTVLRSGGCADSTSAFLKVEDWHRLEIFAAR